MITNFEQFKEKYFSKENDQYTYDFIDNLKHEEIKSLTQEVMKWSDNHFICTVRKTPSFRSGM